MTVFRLTANPDNPEEGYMYKISVPIVTPNDIGRGFRTFGAKVKAKAATTTEERITKMVKRSIRKHTQVTVLDLRVGKTFVYTDHKFIPTSTEKGMHNPTSGYVITISKEGQMDTVDLDKPIEADSVIAAHPAAG